MARTNRHHHNAPAPPITGDCLRNTVVYSATGSIFETSMDYMTTDLGAIGTAEVLNFQTIFDTTNRALLRAVTDPTTTIVGYSTFCLTNNAIPTLALNFNLAGLTGAGPVPQEMACILRKFTLLRGQHGLGRLYMPCVPDTFVSPATEPNRLNAIGLLAFGALAVSLQQTLTDALGRLWVPVVTTRPVPPAFLVSRASAIFNVSTELLLGTQRRRREGRGR